MTARPGARWPPTGLSTLAWRQLEPVLLPVGGLWVTQDVHPVFVLRKMLGEPSWCGDVLPHVIDWSGRWWVEDGHTRVRVAVLRGECEIWCRVWRASDPDLTLSA